MANPVYSSQLILGSASTGYPSFAVPAGFTAVIREFSFWDIAGGAVVELVIQNSGAAPGITVDSLGAVGAAESDRHEGRWVVPEGGIISLTITHVFGSPDVYVGGYLLRNSGP